MKQTKIGFFFFFAVIFSAFSQAAIFVIPCINSNINGLGINCKEFGVEVQVTIHKIEAIEKDNTIDIQQTCEKILQEVAPTDPNNFMSFLISEIKYSAFFFLSDHQEVKYVDCEAKPVTAVDFLNSPQTPSGYCFGDNRAFVQEMEKKIKAANDRNRQKRYDTIKSYLSK